MILFNTTTFLFTLFYHNFLILRSDLKLIKEDRHIKINRNTYYGINGARSPWRSSSISHIF